MEITNESNENSSQNSLSYQTESLKRGFSKKKRKLVFYLILLIHFFNHLDHGAIDACNTYLMTELNLDHSDLGSVGSSVFLGLTFGASIAGYIFNYFTPKCIVSCSIILTSLSLYFLTQSNTLFYLCLCRFFCGFFQIFTLIYFPVWIDQFGIYEIRTIWLSYLQLNTASGTMIGYAIEAVCIKKFNNWRYGFYLQCILLLFSTVVFLLIPDKFLSRNYKRTNLTREFIKNNIKITPEFLKKNNIINYDKYTNINEISIYQIEEENETIKKFNYLETIKTLFKNKLYRTSLISICSILFIITGIEFWITDYMRKILKKEDSKIFISFSIICITSPTCGVLIGGYLIEKLGGYINNNKTLQILLKSSIISFCCGILLPLINNFIIFLILMWFTIFFGGSLMPGLTGILLNSMDDNMKEEGNSITQFCYNLLGYFPSPFLYGIICDFTGGNNSRWGLVFLMSFSVVGMYALKKGRDYQDEVDFDLGKSSFLNRSFRDEISRKKSWLIGRLYGRSDYFGGEE